MAQKSGVTTSPLVRDLQFFADAVPEVRRAWSALRDAQKDLFLDVARRGKDHYMFARWLEKQFRPLHEEMEDLVAAARLHVEGPGAAIYGGGVPDVAEIDIDRRVIAGWRNPLVNALKRLTEKYRNLRIPATLRGRTRSTGLDGARLLRSYNHLYRRAHSFLRQHPFPVGCIGPNQFWLLAREFPDVDGDDLNLIEQRKPGQFAEAVLARWEGRSPHTIHRTLIAARKTAGRVRPRSRIHRQA